MEWTEELREDFRQIKEQCLQQWADEEFIPYARGVQLDFEEMAVLAYAYGDLFSPLALTVEQVNHTLQTGEPLGERQPLTLDAEAQELWEIRHDGTPLTVLELYVSCAPEEEDRATDDAHA